MPPPLPYRSVPAAVSTSAVRMHTATHAATLGRARPDRADRSAVDAPRPRLQFTDHPHLIAATFGAPVTEPHGNRARAGG